MRTPAAPHHSCPVDRAKTRRAVALILLIAVSLSASVANPPLAAASTDLRTATSVPYGQVVVSGNRWLGGGGVDVISNYGRTLTGTYQCVELINRLYETKGWIDPGTWRGDGHQRYANAPAHLAKEPQGSITRVNPGDVIVFNTNFFANYGHVAVVDNVVGSSIRTLSQNTFPADMNSRNLTWSGGNILVNGSSTRVTGIVHAPESSVSRIAVARNRDGRLELFAIGQNWELYHRWQTSPGGSWSSWRQLDGSVSGVAAETNADGRIELIALGLYGEVYRRAQTTPGGGWSGWQRLDGSVHSIALARNRDGRLELFAVGQRGEAYHRWQTAPGGAWSGWRQFDGRISNIAADTSHDGRLELFAVGLRGEVYQRWQTSPGGSWSAWNRRDGRIYREALARNGDGRLELFAIGLFGEVYHRWQTSPGGSWSGWRQFDGRTSNVAVEANADGRLEMFNVGLRGEMYHRWQTSPGGSWSGWRQFDGALHP
jgi:surface antigen